MRLNGGTDLGMQGGLGVLEDAQRRCVVDPHVLR